MLRVFGGGVTKGAGPAPFYGAPRVRVIRLVEAGKNKHQIMRPGALRIRPLAPTDLGAVISFDQAVFAEDAWSPEVIADVVENPRAHAFVAEAEIGELVTFAGCCVLHISGTLGEVATIGVTPEFRRLGVGRQMMDLMIDRSRRMGVKTLKLFVRPSNRPAICLYGAVGFQATRQISGYYESDGGDAQIMEISL